MREVLARLFGSGRDEGFDDLRQRLATHRHRAAERERTVLQRARLLETGHYLGDRAGRRLRLADIGVEVGDEPGRQHSVSDDG